MIKTKYWLSVLAVSVVLLTGSLAVSPIAIADDDDDDGEGPIDHCQECVDEVIEELAECDEDFAEDGDVEEFLECFEEAAEEYEECVNGDLTCPRLVGPVGPKK